MTTAPAEKKRGTLVLKGIVALAVSAATLWWAFHDVDLGNVKEKLGSSTPGVIIFYICAHLTLHLVRVVRFGLLVRPLGPVSWRAVFAAVSVGIPAAFFIPLRLGEFVRPAMLSRTGIPFAGGLAAVVAERIADGVFSVGLFFVLLRFLPDNAVLSADMTSLSNIALAGFGGGMVVLFATYFAKGFVLKVVRAILSPLSAEFAEKICGLLDTFVEGLSGLRSPARFGGFVVLTATFWLANGAATWVLAESYSPGLPFWAGPFAICATVFAVMIPAGPAFAGTMEAGFRFGLSPFAVTAGTAAVIAIASHAVHLLVMALIGGVGLLAAQGTGTATLSQPESEADPPKQPTPSN